MLTVLAETFFTLIVVRTRLFIGYVACGADKVIRRP
jgi:hypothetical protein